MIKVNEGRKKEESDGIIESIRSFQRRQSNHGESLYGTECGERNYRLVTL